MKKKLFNVFVFATVLLLSSCSNGSSGTAMLDLDIRIKPSERVQELLDHGSPKDKQLFEDFSNLFTVLPGPYEFTWEELKNQDGSIGREQCATKLKIRLRLNKTLKPGMKWTAKKMMSEEDMIKAISNSYSFDMFNSEGKTFSELYDENSNDDHVMLMTLDPDLETLSGEYGHKKNTDGLLDFYHFLTSKPGTEFDLILDCGIQLCKDIEDMIAYNKGMYIIINSEPLNGEFRFE